MITIYKTNTFKSASEYVGRQLQNIDKSNLAVQHVVIVPDRASMEAERAVLEKVQGSFNVQVKTFRRLANAFLTGKEAYLTKQAGIMALGGIIADNKDKLSCYTKSTETAGFISNMYDTISMLKYCRISPEKLSAKHLSPSLENKVKDIATLYRLYLEYTFGNYIDSADKMDLLCESIETSEFVKNSYFYLYDFDNLSKQELAIVEKLMFYSQGVTVACCASDRKQDANLYLGDIFDSVNSLCVKNGITPNVIEERNDENAFTKQIGYNLFRYFNADPIANDDFVHLYNPTTRMDEVTVLAEEICKYVRKSPFNRYKDVYVVCSDVTRYSANVARVFDEYGIPYFIDKPVKLSDHAYVRFVTDYLALFINNKSLNAVLPFVKNHLFSANDDCTRTNEDVFYFENFCLKYNVNHSYDKFNLGTEDIFYDNAERVRKKLNDLLTDVVLPPEATVDTYVELIHKLVENSSLVKRNELFAQAQTNSGFTFDGKATLQAPDKFESVLEQAKQVIGKRTMKLADFYRTLLSALGTVNINVLPTKNDCVVFANMAKARKHDVKYLALLGANYGAMPIVKKDTGLISDENIDELAKQNVFVEPQISTENKRERFSLFQLLQEPSDGLFVSYPSFDEGSLLPSPFVDKLGKLFYENGQALTCKEISNEIFTERQAVSRIVADEHFGKDTCRVVDGNSKTVDAKLTAQAKEYVFDKSEKVTVQNGDKLFFTEKTSTVSKLSAYYDCPYHFYMRYGLGVKPREIAKLEKSDLGTILHEVLENYVKACDKNEPDERTEQLARTYFDNAMSSDHYQSIARDKKMQRTVNNLRNESVRLCKEIKSHLSSSSFVNMGTEIEFGDNQTFDGVAVNGVEIKFNGGMFVLKGIIDRVDCHENYFVVIDYKSGKHSSEYKEENLYTGRKMQLFVYMLAIKQAFGLTPAGFYYFNLHDNFTEPSKEEVYFYNGRTVEDVGVATALDHNLANGKSVRLRLSLKDGEIKKSSASVTQQQIENELDYTVRLIKKTGEKMLKGYVAVSPYEGVCTFCDYKAICDYNDVFTNQQRNCTYVKASTIDDIIQKPTSETK